MQRMFDSKAKYWDQDPMKVERAQSVAKHIMKKLTDRPYHIGMEYGCGTGLLGSIIREYFDKLIMADTSSNMLKVLDKKIELNGITNMKTVLIDLLTENIDEKVDILFSLMVLHHIKNIDLILEKWNTIIHDKGILFIADIDEENGLFHYDGETEHNGINRVQLMNKLRNIGYTHITDETAYIIKKEVNNIEKEFSVFLITATK